LDISGGSKTFILASAKRLEFSNLLMDTVVMKRNLFQIDFLTSSVSIIYLLETQTKKCLSLTKNLGEWETSAVPRVAKRLPYACRTPVEACQSLSCLTEPDGSGRTHYISKKFEIFICRFTKKIIRFQKVDNWNWRHFNDFWSRDKLLLLQGIP